MKNKKPRKKDLNLMSSPISEIGLIAQTIFSIVTLAFGIGYLFLPDFLILAQVFLIILLLVIAYNNYTTFKRKTLTIIYIIAAFLVLSAIIM